MNFKFAVLLLLLLSVLFVVPPASNGYSSQSLGTGPTTFVIASSSYPDTINPPMASGAASGELIANVYDTLVAYKGSDPNNIVPWLAESYSVSEDGQTYQFIVRQNVPWQNASYGFLTPGDVEYSLEKVLVRDYYMGAAWTLWYPIFGQFEANLTDPIAQGLAIDNAITSNATGVTIQFQTDKAYPAFLGILAQTVGSIMSKQWCIDQGEWNPAVHKLDDGTWVNIHNPSRWIPLDYMMGTGPYRLDYWTHGYYANLTAYSAWSVVRNPTFWGGWNSSRGSLLGIMTPVLGYLDRITEHYVSSYSARLAEFLGSDPIYDSISVPIQNMSSVWQKPGIKCIYPLSSPVMKGLFFTYDVGTHSAWIGEGNTPGFTFGPTGIRRDFFSDVHVRRAMAYSFNWTQFIGSSFSYSGEKQQNVLPLPVWDAFYNSSLTGYSLNPAKAIEEWKMAWGGTLESPGPVWTQGFKFTAIWRSYPEKLTAFESLKSAVEAENPLFHIDVMEYNYYDEHPWSGNDGRAEVPLFIYSGVAAYPDADNLLTTFIQSSGSYAFRQHIDLDPYSGLMDNLIDYGARNTTFAGRNVNYQQLWQLYLQQAPSIPLGQAYVRQWTRDWVQGWYYNPVYPGHYGTGVYGYTMWKGQELPIEDVNSDSKVDIKDLAIAAKAFGAYYIQPLPPFQSGLPGYHTPNWNSKADVNSVYVRNGTAWVTVRGDSKIDIKDLATIAKLYGYTAPEWQPPP